jgi:hypothetical protein
MKANVFHGLVLALLSLALNVTKGVVFAKVTLKNRIDLYQSIHSEDQKRLTISEGL